jgi:hypothetical protein
MQNKNTDGKKRKSSDHYVRLAMLRIHERNEIITTEKIIAETGLTVSFLSRVLREMEEVPEEKKMIAITKDLSDARFNNIKFTRYGLAETGILSILSDVVPDRDEAIEAAIKVKNMFYSLVGKNKGTQK